MFLCLALPAAAVAAPTTGTLRLSTGARGAPVYIDGVLAGVAPLPGPWTLPPGEHTVELRPKGKAPVSARFAVSAGQEAAIELLPAATPEVTESLDAAAAGRTRVIYSGPGFSLATAGYVTAGVGVASGALAVLFGLQAESKAEEARGLDKSNPAFSRATELALIDDADRAAFLANLTMGVGIVAGVAGLSMVFLASDGPLGGLSVAPAPGGAVVGGRF
jgi:hypothetical protein